MSTTLLSPETGDSFYLTAFYLSAKKPAYQITTLTMRDRAQDSTDFIILDRTQMIELCAAFLKHIAGNKHA